MNQDDSFKFLFYDLLQFIDEKKIFYRHEVHHQFEKDYDGTVLLAGLKWELTITKAFNCKSPDELTSEIKDCIKMITEEFRENRLELGLFLQYFIDELDQRIQYFTHIVDDQFKFEELVTADKINLIYQGYLPIRNHDSSIYKSVSKPQDADHDEFDYNQLQKEVKQFVKNIIVKLRRLNLFLKHESNLFMTQSERLVNRGPKEDKYLGLIKKASFTELFTEIDQDEKYKNNRDMIQLSARYYALEKDKIKNIIERKDYDIQMSKLTDHLLNVLFREQQ